MKNGRACVRNMRSNKLNNFFSQYTFVTALMSILQTIFQIASEKDASGKVKPIPILDGRVVGDDDNLSLRVVHGNYIRPVFETLVYDSLETLTCLVRQPPTANGQQKSTAGSSNLVVSSSFLIEFLVYTQMQIVKSRNSQVVKCAIF